MDKSDFIQAMVSELRQQEAEQTGQQTESGDAPRAYQELQYDFPRLEDVDARALVDALRQEPLPSWWVPTERVLLGIESLITKHDVEGVRLRVRSPSEDEEAQEIAQAKRNGEAPQESSLMEQHDIASTTAADLAAIVYVRHPCCALRGAGTPSSSSVPLPAGSDGCRSLQLPANVNDALRRLRIDLFQGMSAGRWAESDLTEQLAFLVQQPALEERAGETVEVDDDIEGPAAEQSSSVSVPLWMLPLDVLLHRARDVPSNASSCLLATKRLLQATQHQQRIAILDGWVSLAERGGGGFGDDAAAACLLPPGGESPAADCGELAQAVRSVWRDSLPLLRDAMQEDGACLMPVIRLAAAVLSSAEDEDVATGRGDVECMWDSGFLHGLCRMPIVWESHAEAVSRSLLTPARLDGRVLGLLMESDDAKWHLMGLAASGGQEAEDGADAGDEEAVPGGNSAGSAGQALWQLLGVVMLPESDPSFPLVARAWERRGSRCLERTVAEAVSALQMWLEHEEEREGLQSGPLARFRLSEAVRFVRSAVTILHSCPDARATTVGHLLPQTAHVLPLLRAVRAKSATRADATTERGHHAETTSTKDAVTRPGLQRRHRVAEDGGDSAVAGTSDDPDDLAEKRAHMAGQLGALLHGLVRDVKALHLREAAQHASSGHSSQRGKLD